MIMCEYPSTLILLGYHEVCTRTALSGEMVQSSYYDGHCYTELHAP